MIAPRFSSQPLPLRRAGPCAAGVPVPEGAFSSRSPSGAAYSLLTVALPDPVIVLLRLVCAHERCEDEAAMISRLIAAHAGRIGIAALAGNATPCEAGKGREGMPSGAFPPPQGPKLQGGEAASRMAHNHDVAGSSPAPATSSVSARTRVAGREDEASGVLPPPQGPP